MAKQFYKEVLSEIDPSFCDAASYLAELHVHMPQYDAAKARAALHLACLLCGDKSIHLDDVRLAYAKRNIIDAPTCPSVVTKDVGDSMQVSYIVDDGGSADADASILVHASVPHMSWLGIGISDDGSMSGSGGSGSDMAICDSSGLKRFFVTSRTKPIGGRTVDGDQDACMMTANSSSFVFRRTLASSGSREVAVKNGNGYLIWAHGIEGEENLVYHYARKGRMALSGEGEDDRRVDVAYDNLGLEESSSVAFGIHLFQFLITAVLVV